MESIQICLFFKKMLKSVLTFPKIILANNNLNWVNILEAEKLLLP